MSRRLNQTSEFDVLGDILETLRFRGSIFFRSELAAPWGMSLTETKTPYFHIVLSGECFIGAGHGDAIQTHEGDIVMLPNGGSHWIADKPGRELISSESAGEACALGNPLFQHGKITNSLICGMVHFDRGATHPILDALPELMHFPMNEPDGTIWALVKLIDNEMANSTGSSSQIADRLTEVLFLQLLNNYIQNSSEAGGFLMALRDRRVHRALTLIHQEPEFDWSLDSLGERVGMSRATLVRRFQSVVGESPMAYIKNWRIMKAYNLVKHSSSSLEQIALSVGFASARTLAKAFEREYSVTPSELRRGQKN
ncbi:MAG: AraC-like DNA-binding protein [Parasphingorhabdus sp.]